jgi:hypothetical protein
LNANKLAIMLRDDSEIGDKIKKKLKKKHLITGLTEQWGAGAASWSMLVFAVFRSMT